MFDFALDEVGTIRTLLHEELRPSPGVTFKTCRRRYSHLDVRGLADGRAGAPLLLLAAGSGTKARVQRKAR